MGDYYSLKAHIKQKVKLGLWKQFVFYYPGGDFRIIYKDRMEKCLSISKPLSVTRVKYPFLSVYK